MSTDLGFDIDDLIMCPTFGQAFRFFRDRYNLHYFILTCRSQMNGEWGFNYYVWDINIDATYTSEPNAPAGEWKYKTYEEAELDALRKLIELAKLKENEKNS